MDEPTDQALKVQGLNRSEYDSMSPEGKSVIASRSRRLVDLSTIGIAAELLNVIAEGDEKKSAYIAEVLDGKHPDFEEKIRVIMREYLDTDVETNIRDYYRIKYNNIDIISSPLEKDQPPATPQQPKPPSREQQPEPKTQPVTEQDRKRNIAMILSKWEKKDVETVMGTEMDIMEHVITVADENRDKGLTDYSICMACETMITNGTQGVQFYREALIPENRDQLLLLAKAFA